MAQKPLEGGHDPSALVLPYAEQALKQGADCFICGHFHYPLQTSISEMKVTVLGDWIHQFSYLELINGKAELKSFQDSDFSDASSDRVH